jgi:hypothetical protein
MSVSAETSVACPGFMRAVESHRGFPLFLRIPLLIVAVFLLCSCTLLSHSPLVARMSEMPVLGGDHLLISETSGRVPYQRWRIPPWDEDLRYVWMVGDYDFKRFDQVELILYFHGMHSKDYYSAFRKELEQLAEKRPNRPFLFVGFVDTPFLPTETRSKDRWSSLSPQKGERPDRLIKTVNRVFKAFRTTFPNVRKDKTSIVLAGFSGGGRVLNSIGNWLAHSEKDDPYAAVFRGRLSKIVYFDCWFDKDVIDTVPALLANNPGIKIVGTVHMKKPLEHAVILAGKYKMKADKKKNELVGLGGRLVIFRDQSHWSAMIARLKEAL